LDFVHGDRDVLDVLRGRRAAGSRPGQRDDGLRVALVVEGGGMRGVYAGGMVSALESLGLRNAFDDVYGTSAGAFSAVALAIGEGSKAGAVYYEDLASRDFINYRRALTGRGPLISLDYLVEHVLEKSKPLDYERLAGSDIPVRTVATRLDTGVAEELTGLASADDWRAALCATSCVPFLCGPAISLQGAQWIDGSVAEPIAIERALDGEATHVLVLLSRAPTEKSPKGGEHPLMSVVARGLDPVVAEALRRRAQKHATAMQLLTGKGLLAVRPTIDCGINGLTTNIPRLRRAEETGAAAVHALFAA
jgi:predicted patatin/cPLA2 family phospholipase